MPPETPFVLALGDALSNRFPAIQRDLVEQGRAPSDRDAFVLTQDAAALIRELRPDQGVGEAIDQLVAFVHHAFLWWAGGEHLLGLTAPELRAVLAEPVHATDAADGVSFYAALPQRILWAEVIDGAPVEPLDGCSIQTDGDAIRVLGVFGIRAGRSGFSVVETSGPRAAALARPDATALFASRLAGGMPTDLHSIDGGEELLELGWRLRDVAAASP